MPGLVEMSVVGFDIGNENCVISVVKQRGIDVLLNDESNVKPHQWLWDLQNRLLPVQVQLILFLLILAIVIPQVSIASFEAGYMKILSHAYDRSFGEAETLTRASVRLRVACEKLKKVLSANAEAPLNIECLMDEKDVDCGQDHAVELVGSGSRIPAISRLLASLFREEPRRTLNVSECVARGCALQCAMLSPIFPGQRLRGRVFGGKSLLENLERRKGIGPLERIGTHNSVAMADLLGETRRWRRGLGGAL
ncbi:Heat shock 70 kDa protein 16 [Vitis vinifera]|uniref:Heat shock 70 kDa protein 16 n=1 Tax=Vitis vinifera TaxID=29760 RepID=A0A438DY67_VITVI|nr:Heat shock 70 kDa protein 16 [Vitis vinifera]